MEATSRDSSCCVAHVARWMRSARATSSEDWSPVRGRSSMISASSMPTPVRHLVNRWPYSNLSLRNWPTDPGAGSASVWRGSLLLALAALLLVLCGWGSGGTAPAAGLEAPAFDGVYVIAKQGAQPLKVVAGLNDPLGLAWYAGRLYVASVGRGDAYGGFNGHRFTTHERILSGPVVSGENNLLVMAPDGRFVMGVTATCDHCTPTSALSGSIVSFRPDGSDLRLYARGIRAPFGLAFMPGTSELFASMNQRDDLAKKTPGDWLTLVREGQNWRFPGCYGQGGAICSGVPRSTAVLDVHAAAGGVAITTGQLGASIGTSALVPEWALAKVQRVALRKEGFSYQGSVTPFLTGIANPLAIA